MTLEPAETYMIVLPELNGELDAGIVVGIDPALEDADRLIVRTKDGTGNDVKKSVARDVAMRALCAKYGNKPASLKWFVCAAASLFEAGFLCHNDGDILTGNVGAEFVSDDSYDIQITSFLNKTDMDIALSFAVGTKANWWLINHHTGQGEMQGYAKKMAAALLPNMNTNEAAHLLHTI
ncbi:Uncharacterised protein r2_g788 [Pycnogonum litorale]